VERQLENSWMLHQSIKELNVQRHFIASYILRNRMLHFIKNFVYYMTVEVLEPNFHKFKQNLTKIKTIDDVLVLHNNFLDECLKECLLTDQDLFTNIYRINQATLFFSRIFNRFQSQMMFEDKIFNQPSPVLDEDEVREEINYLQHRKEKIEKQSQSALKVVQEASYQRMIDKFVTSFNTHLKDLLK